MSKRRTGGFTLIELMVTITITGILLAVAVPSLRSQFERSRAKGAAEEFASAIRLARSEAMLGSRTIFLAVKTGTAWCFGFSDAAANCNCSVTGACLVRGQDRHTTGTDLAMLTLATASTMTAATLGRDGVITGNGFVQFSSGSTSTRVVVSPVGRTTLCGDNMVGWVPMANC